MRLTTLPRPSGPLSAFLTSGSLASVLVFGNMAVEAAENEKDKEVEWRKDVTKIELPKVPARGKVAGRDFKVEKASLGSGILKLRQGKDFFADLEFMIFTFEHDEAKLPGKVFNVKPGATGISPHIHMKFKEKEKGKNLPTSELFMKGYSLRLEFGTMTKEGLPGSIYLCLPDGKKSFVAGTFVAEME